jgi:hypothetical protein
VAELKATMSHAEFLRWQEYYNISPFDDMHRHYRPAALIARSMSGGDVSEMLEWLQPREAENEGYSDADIQTFKALGMSKPPRRS